MPKEDLPIPGKVACDVAHESLVVGSHCALLSSHYTMRNAQCVVHSSHCYKYVVTACGFRASIIRKTGAWAGEVE